jgi:glycosyltransferase involved in cell wall biosynthesis
LKNKNKIAFLDHTAKWSGGEIALYRMMTAMKQDRFYPYLFVGMDGDFAKKSSQAGIPVEIMPLNEKLLNIKKENIDSKIFNNSKILTGYVNYTVKLAQILRKKEIDLVHCNSLKSDIYGLVASTIARKKVIWHVRDHIDENYLTKRTADIFKYMALKFPNGVITNSKSTYQALFHGKNVVKPSCVVYDGLMANELAMTMRQPRNDNKKTVKIGLLGRITRWKGQHVAIKALANLIENGYDVDLKIIGSAMFGEKEYENEIRSLAKPLDSHIDFLGFQSDVFAMLKELDILVHCSVLPEPFGQVIIEGMAEGLPVIASDAGGAKEIITSGIDGILTPAGDDVALAASLSNLIDNPKFAYGLATAGYKKVRTLFTAENTAREIEDFYCKILSLD